MDTLFAIKGKNFVAVVADTYSNYSIIRIHDSQDKIMEIGDNKVLALAGPVGDCKQFGEYIRCNIHLHQIRHGTDLSTQAAASFARTELASALRRNPFYVNILLAGYDKPKAADPMAKTEPRLFRVDHLGSMVELDKAAHGYGSHILLSILDRYYKPNMERDEVLELIQRCAKELKNRFLLGTAKYIIKIIGENGTEKEQYIDVSDMQKHSTETDMIIATA